MLKAQVLRVAYLLYILTGAVAKKVGKGFPKGWLRSILLPLRGSDELYGCGVTRGYIGQEDEPQGADQVHPFSRHESRHSYQAGHQR